MYKDYLDKGYLFSIAQKIEDHSKILAERIPLIVKLNEDCRIAATHALLSGFVKSCSNTKKYLLKYLKHALK